jgi:hypothetical protein
MTSWTDDEVGGTVWSDDESGAADGSLTGSEVDVDADKVRVIDATDNRPKLVTVEELVANTSVFTQSGSGATAETVEDALRRVVWVEQFGAVGDGTTDDATAIQAALDAIGSSGGEVRFGPKTYKITAGLSTNTANIALVGAGNVGQDATLGGGSTIIDVSGAIVGFTFNSAASSTNFRGPLLRDLHFTGSASGTGGILIKRSNNWLLENVAVSGFTAGYGIKSDGTGNVNQYGTLIEPKLHNCLTGYHGILSNGVMVFGGYMDANSNGGSVRASSTGIKQETGDTLKVFGLRIQYYETAIDLQAGEAHEIHGCRFEGFTTGLKIASPNAALYGGNFNNNILGSVGTAISVIAGGTECRLFPAAIESVAARISIATVTDTFYIDANAIRVNQGITLQSQGTSGNLRIINNAYVDSSLVVAAQTAGAKVLFGSAQDTNLYRTASNVLGTDDAFQVAATTATPAGGSTAARLVFGTTTGFGIYYGSGAPSVSAGQGSIYLRSDGSSTSTRLYVNTDGGTTWTNFTSAT